MHYRTRQAEAAATRDLSAASISKENILSENSGESLGVTYSRNFPKNERTIFRVYNAIVAERGRKAIEDTLRPTPFKEVAFFLLHPPLSSRLGFPL